MPGWGRWWGLSCVPSAAGWPTSLGGATVTLWNFVVMALAVVGVIVFLPQGGVGGNFGGFFVCFLFLFLTTGIGNGSTFRMIPVIFLTEAMRGVNTTMRRRWPMPPRKAIPGRCHTGLYGRLCGVRRFLYSEELWQFHCLDGRARTGTMDLAVFMWCASS